MAEGSWMCGATWEEAAVDCMWHCISPMPHCYCVIWLFSVIYQTGNGWRSVGVWYKVGGRSSSCGSRLRVALHFTLAWLLPLDLTFLSCWKNQHVRDGKFHFSTGLMHGWLKALAANCFSQICVVFLVKQMIKQMISWVVWLITFPFSMYKLDK